MSQTITSTKPTREQLAYLAGYIDGEGCLRLSDSVLCVEINNTYPAVLFKMQKFFGGRVRMKTISNGKYRTVWNYTAYSTTAKAVLEAILPFLDEKLLQAELLVEFSDTDKTNQIRREEIKLLLKSLKRINYFK